MQKQNFGEKSYVIDQRLKEYPISLNFYHQPPSGTVTLNDFESSALDRLSVLIAIESARLRAKKDEDVNSLVERVIQEHLELKPNSYNLHPEKLVAQRRKDHLSHYVLRLAYCKTQALQNWFLKLESYLFKIRYMNASQEERNIFMEEAKTFAGLDYVSITSDEMKKEVGHADMSIISQQMRILYDDCSLFYKTKWKNVCDLVAKRMVIVHRGFAYVPSSQHIVLVVKAFHDHLSHELKEIAKGIPRLDEDDRIMPILHSMAKQSLSKDYEITNTGDAITANDVAKLKQHFPPCMSQLQSNLVQQGHLKHTARLQYGLFLKGIGLSLEEALIFWRKSFNKMSDDEYEKKGYNYNIRYNYGMEGKRTNYTPYSCSNIIATVSGPGEVCGCPFKNLAAEPLGQLLQSMRLDSQHCDEVVSKAKSGHYQLACTRFFELTRGKGLQSGGIIDSEKKYMLPEPINHPNRYFDFSSKGIVNEK